MSQERPLPDDPDERYPLLERGASSRTPKDWPEDWGPIRDTRERAREDARTLWPGSRYRTECSEGAALCGNDYWACRYD